MLSETQVQQFRRDGFLNGGAVLSPDQVQELRDELDRVIADRDRPDVPQPVMLSNWGEGTDKALWQVVNIWMASDPYRRLMEHPKLTEEIAQLTGASQLRVWHDQIQYKPAYHGGVNMWHQDAPLWPILAPMTEVSAWVALDDVDESNGCMSMVRGSHLWGNQIAMLHKLPAFGETPSEFQGHPVEVVLRPVRAGEVHYHHALTWHGSHENSSGRPRRAIAVHYMTGETRYVASGQHVMKQFVTVGDGELMTDDAFPLVYDARQPASR